MKRLYSTLLYVSLGMVLSSSGIVAQTLDQFLTGEGYLSDDAINQETINAEGWQMQLEADGTPRFLKEDQHPVNLSALPPQVPDDEYWSGAFARTGVVGALRVVALSGCDDIYVGGDFTEIGGVQARNIARWDGSQWHSLGQDANNGVDGTVHAITVVEDDVYVGGRFDSAGTRLVYNLARWDGLQWNGVGGGVDSWDEWDLPAEGTVYTIAVEGSDVYVGGDFDSVGTGITTSTQTFARNVARWDGTMWRPMGPGLEGDGTGQPTDLGAVRDIEFGFDGIYAAGRFVSSGDMDLNGIARWDGAVWRQVGTNPTVASGKVDIFTMQVQGADVYIGGRFDRVGGVDAHNIAIWAGLLKRWFVLGNGSTDTVQSLFVDGGRVYAAGEFGTSVNGEKLNNVAVWEEGAWRSLGTRELNGTDDAVWSIVASGSNVYMSGRFKTAGSSGASGLALWSVATQTWTPLNQGSLSIAGGVNGPVYALALTDEYLYVGGRFSSVGQVRTNSLARWNRRTGVWSPLGGGIKIDPEISETLLPSVRAITVEGEHVYVGGRFDFAARVRANNIARWNGSQWEPLGSGIGLNGQGGPYDSLSVVTALDAKDGVLYVGGEYTIAGGSLANRVASWTEGAGWEPVGGGIGGASFNTQVNAILASGDDVFVGGTFTTVGTANVRASNIARWDGTEWHGLGRGINNEVFALAATDGGELFVGGNFTRAGNVSGVSHIARWDGEEWSQAGLGFTTPVRALAAGRNGVFAAGDFKVSGPTFVSHIARWDGVQWVELGSGLDAGQETPRGLAVAVDGDDLFVGGLFAFAGGISSQNIAYWSKPGGVPPPTPSSVTRNRAVDHLDLAVSTRLAPNPVVDQATFHVELSKASNLRIAIYSASGEEVALIQEGMMPEGREGINWDATLLPAGFYTWRVSGSGIQKSGSFIVEH